MTNHSPLFGGTYRGEDGPRKPGTCDPDTLAIIEALGDTQRMTDYLAAVDMEAEAWEAYRRARSWVEQQEYYARNPGVE